MPKILLVDDDISLCQTLVDCFEHDLYKVDCKHTCQDAKEFLSTYQYDVIVLDWRLPDGSGVDTMSDYRKAGGSTPILLLTAECETSDKEVGLDAGADDYLTKPFQIVELMARVRALLRRSTDFAGNVIRVGHIELNRLTHEVTKAGVLLNLSANSFALLEFLMRNVNRIYNAEALIDRVWSVDSEVGPETVRSVISRLRAQIDIEGEPSLIESIYGAGYRMRAPSQSEMAKLSPGNQLTQIGRHPISPIRDGLVNEYAYTGEIGTLNR